MLTVAAPVPPAPLACPTPRPTPGATIEVDRPAPAVAVVGLGYVGLPTLLSLHEAGLTVVGVDVSASRLEAIRSVDVDLLPADRVRLRRALAAEGASLLTDEPSALTDADAVLICVPTPIDAHLVPDLGALVAACATVVEHARRGQTLVLTSTTYVGCTRDLLVAGLAERGLVAGEDVFVAFSPERIDPGHADHVPQTTPRVVGGVTDACTRHAVEVLGHAAPRVHAVSSPEAAEMTKLLENTFRAVNIALANEFSGLAGELGVDPIEVVTAAATKPYGFMPFYPGPGVGGHCIPCDPHYLLWQMRTHRVTSPLTQAAMESIAARPRRVLARAEQVLAREGRPLQGARVLVVGVAYKPGVADVRESPALYLLDELEARGAQVAFHDPLVPEVVSERGVPRRGEKAVRGRWDLVVVHTLHPGTDLSGVPADVPVLDASYRLPARPGHHVV